MQNSLSLLSKLNVFWMHGLFSIPIRRSAILLIDIYAALRWRRCDLGGNQIRNSDGREMHVSIKCLDDLTNCQTSGFRVEREAT